MIKSVYYRNEDILDSIIKLHIPSGKFDLDPTYSKGNFYKWITEPYYKYDINPQTENTIKADCRNLPLKDKSVQSIVFDPPFLATKGPSLEKKDGNNIIVKNYSCYPNERELHNFYIDSLKEFYRLLKDKGILVVKCQDKVSSGNQYFSHCFIHEQAVKQGFYPIDLFILIARSRIIGRIKNQHHARKYHSYFWVFKKENKTVKYV